MKKKTEIHGSNYDDFPEAWACDWGEDGFGVWMSFRYKGVRQCFRRVEGDSFLMGSPLDELQRDDDEKQHQVSLSNGFWIADTAVTQELWEAVAGDNPAEFKGEKNPVENISWNDCIAFIEKLNGLMPERELRLPTEAEWEYACRAKSTGPFHFGENITTDQVNYDGDNPYADGSKGEYRETTVPVKSLPCNNFGLYEMHGNVWEWCRDWYGPYPDGPVVDPVGPDKGEGRVLRGGSWIDDGRDVRSALRNRVEPSLRVDFTGFRLARGQRGRAAELQEQEHEGGLIVKPAIEQVKQEKKMWI